MRSRPSLVVAISLTLASVALASDEAHHHAAGIPWTTLILSAINLSIFIWILARFVMPTVRVWVHDRRNQVVRALEEAAAAKAEALRVRVQWEERLAGFERAVEEMRAQARRDAERERERLLEAARKAAAAIRRDAERAAAYEIRRTQEQLRAELVRQALRAAEDAVRMHWSAADQQGCVSEFLKQVQQ